MLQMNRKTIYIYKLFAWNFGISNDIQSKIV